MTFNHEGTYKCVCGKEFQSANSFNGHKAHCPEHQIQKHGSLEFYKQVKRDKDIKNSNTQKVNANLRKQKSLEQWIAEKHQCETCGKVMTEKYGSGRFCCKSCASVRQHTQETKDKLSRKSIEYNNKSQEKRLNRYYKSPKKCVICNNILSYDNRHRQTCCVECKNQLISIKTLERVESGTHNGWIKRGISSYAEKFWETVLINNNIEYVKEFKLNTNNTYYFMDFLLYGFIDLEIDGKQHRHRIEHDKLRDERICNNGYIVYRIPYINPKHKEEIRKQIDDFLSFIEFYKYRGREFEPHHPDQ